MKTLSLAIALFVATAAIVPAASLRISEVVDTTEVATTVLPFTYGPRVEKLIVRDAAIITEKDVEKAMAFSSKDGYGVLLTLNPEGEKRFHTGIQHLERKRIAIVLDGKIVSAPILATTSFGKELHLHGPFTEQEARDIAIALSPPARQ